MIIKAKDIHDCEDCPLYDNECPGGWTSGAGGTPIEPPCCNWDDEDEIYDGMYDYDDSDYPTTWDIQREKEYQERQQEELEKERLKEKERLRQLVYKKTKYGITKTKYYGSIVDSWFCIKCNRWVYPCSEWIHDGIAETSCPRCYETLVYCSELDGDE